MAIANIEFPAIWSFYSCHVGIKNIVAVFALLPAPRSTFFLL